MFADEIRVKFRLDFDFEVRVQSSSIVAIDGEAQQNQKKLPGGRTNVCR